jgi:predicted CopG family antitoxin
MANRDIKKEVKKKKKGDTGVLPSVKPMMSEPEVIKKSKKNA